MALLELRQELYNESGVCESTLNSLASLPSADDNAGEKLKSSASLSGSNSNVNTITKFATDIVLLEQRLALVFFLLHALINELGSCSTLEFSLFIFSRCFSLNGFINHRVAFIY